MNACIAWAGGSSAETTRTDGGSRLSGIISPPSSIEGRKISCDQSTVAREFADTTPINAPSAPKVNTVRSAISTKAPQFTGSAPPNSGAAVTTIRVEAMSVWSIVVSAGMLRIDKAGTPLIL